MGEPLSPPAGTSLGDPLAAAELSEAVRARDRGELLEGGRAMRYVTATDGVLVGYDVVRHSATASRC